MSATMNAALLLRGGGPVFIAVRVGAGSQWQTVEPVAEIFATHPTREGHDMAWQAPFSRNSRDWRERIAPWIWFFLIVFVCCACVGVAVVVKARWDLR